ncbi:S-layer homology domain-containing protein [Paenibacillus sp. GXUN7292]|uniref:S-layer homology domain-containing protein n=1 Tax=Paenibacillus sp. GXUN7292 TaxID=3422499 RepID=UPI003D7EEDE1
MKRRLLSFLAMILFVSQLTVVPGGFGDSAQAAGAEEVAEKLHYYITPHNFNSYGVWSLTGDWVTGRATASTPGEANGGDGGEPAVAIVNVQSTGTYKLWVRDRDYATNQPGTRSFHVGVDGVRIDKVFGTHGQEGFRWSEVGEFELNAGGHELSLIDTSGFYARSEGFFLTKDLDFVPPEDKELLAQIAPPEDPFGWLPSANFPEWAEADVVPIKTAMIENGKTRVVFYQGNGENGAIVQNEIFIKDGENWLPVKQKTEQFGFLMMQAVSSEFVGQDDQFAMVRQELELGGNKVGMAVGNFFRTGIPIWYIPTDFTQIDENKIELSFADAETQLQVLFEFDELSYDPKVTLNAEFTKDGVYSFMLFSGNETNYDDYETVTAPMLYVKKNVPDKPVMIPQSYLYTPMATLHYAEGNGRFQGREVTSGIALDPNSVPQQYAFPDTSAYALVLRGPEGDVRPQLAAPMFGTEHSEFDAGSSYSVSYRIINETGSWYDTFKHVAEDLYNAKDVRSNYFHSVNEAIYNATDLMMDDDFGGWDSVNMAHYNMEEQDMTTTANGMAALQRYLLTENEELLDKRAIPTLVFMMNRLNSHYKITDSQGGANYSSVLPTPMGGPVRQYSTAVFSGLYEMTQGRVPYLLDYALNFASQGPNFAGVTDQGALYKYTGDERYRDKVIELADHYIQNHPNTGANREKRFIDGFVYGDYIPMVATLLSAYEITGEQRFLDAAEENAHLLMTGLWTTGYHGDLMETEYTVLPETGDRMLFADNYTFWWHGDRQWRLGNPDGQANPPQISGPAIQEETAPSWVSSRAGMGTEHAGTPGHGNVITMNNWAGNLIRLAEYTGDDYFNTMARSAILGRFGNYAGYYQDRIIYHQMKENYPYAGPDYTSVYWHHIPVFITMLEEFLINSAWAKSEQQIAFPSLYQSGYAYFISNQYGHAPGKFYDQDEMWLWLDRGIVEPNSVEIDYIAARKEGVLGVALMNEGNRDLTETIKLGEKVDPDSSYTGTATVYDAQGHQSSIEVVNGEFNLTIPSKGIMSVVLNGLATVKTPVYANTDYEFSDKTEDTVSEHTRGKGYVLQVSPDSYHAYVYITDMDKTTSKLTMTYNIGEETRTVTKDSYPFEFLIKVDDPNAAFEYELTAENLAGAAEAMGGGTLKVNSFSQSGITIGEEPATDGVNIRSWVMQTGNNPSSNTHRFVVAIEDFYPYVATENSLAGLPVKASFRNRTNGLSMTLNSKVVGNEMRTNRTMVVVVEGNAQLPLGTYADYDILLEVAMPHSMISFDRDQYPITVVNMGENITNNTIRIVVRQSDFPFEISTDSLVGYHLAGTISSLTDQTVLNLDSAIIATEVRTNGEAVLVVKATDEVPRKNYKLTEYSLDLELVVPELNLAEPIQFGANIIGQNPSLNLLRIAVPKSSLPFTLTMPKMLNGYRLSGEIQNKANGTILPLDTMIVGAESSGSNYILIVRPTSRVARAVYEASDNNFWFTLHPELGGTWRNSEALMKDEFEYTIDPAEQTVTITRFLGTRIAHIPGTIAGLPVTRIGNSAFQNKKLIEVSIPEGVTHIGHSAFRDNQLSSVTIPGSVARIDDAAFRLNALTKVVIGGTDTILGEGLFTSNPQGLTVFGYSESSAEAYAAAQLHNFVNISPSIAFSPNGNESWQRSAAAVVHVERGGSTLEYVWSPHETLQEAEVSWQSFTNDATLEISEGEGERFLHVRTTDIMGKIVHAHSQRFMLDRTGPVVEFSPDGSETTVSKPTTAVTIMDSGSGVAPGTLRYIWTTGSNAPDANANWQSFASDEELTVSGTNGDWYLHIQSADLLGNETSMTSRRFRVYNAPVVTQPPHTSTPAPEATPTPGPTHTPSPEVTPTPGPSHTEQPVEFIDLAGHWSEKEVKELAGQSLIKGYPDNTFRPDQRMTRAEFVTMIVRIFKLDGASPGQFDDITGHWAQPAINAALANNIINGLSTSRFGPDDSITREQMMVIIMRLHKIPEANQVRATFTDAANISSWAQAAVAWAAEQGIAKGYPDGSFRPSGKATRAEAIAIIVRALAIPL